MSAPLPVQYSEKLPYQMFHFLPPDRWLVQQDGVGQYIQCVVHQLKNISQGGQIHWILGGGNTC